jgi:hypothetical protein
MSIRSLSRKLRRFAEMGSSDKRLFLCAVCWLAVARAWIAVVSFPKLAESLNSEEGYSEADPELLERIRFAVGAAAGNVPWRSDCFLQAIAAHKLLQRHGLASSIHLGVQKEDKQQLLAHAWLTCGDTVVTGGQDLDRYAEIHRLGG